MNPSSAADYRIKNILQHEPLLKEIQNHLRTNFLEAHTLPDLCKKFGTNEYMLKLGFRVLFNTTVFSFLLNLRLAHAKHQLLTTRKTIKEIADEVGYQNANHFSTAFKRKFGIKPVECRGLEIEEYALTLEATLQREKKRASQPITWKPLIRSNDLLKFA